MEKKLPFNHGMIGMETRKNKVFFMAIETLHLIDFSKCISSARSTP